MKDYIKLLEACTMFDPRPRFKERNQAMVHVYMRRVRSRFQMSPLDSSRAATGAVTWFTSPFVEYNEKGETAVSYFAGLGQVAYPTCLLQRTHKTTHKTKERRRRPCSSLYFQRSPSLTQFAALALRVLKFVPCTALVEARFSLTSTMKSKKRMHLGINRLGGCFFSRRRLRFLTRGFRSQRSGVG